MDVSYLVCAIALCGLSGLLGYYIGSRIGSAEGFLNGAVTVLLENDNFLSYSSHLVKHAMESAEADADDDDGMTV